MQQVWACGDLYIIERARLAKQVVGQKQTWLASDRCVMSLVTLFTLILEDTVAHGRATYE